MKCISTKISVELNLLLFVNHLLGMKELLKLMEYYKNRYY